MKALREAPIAVPWLGILRADWPLVPLRYLVRFLSGGTPDKGNADFWSGGAIPWVSPKDMKVDRINDSEDHITVAALDGSSTQLVPVGSVLVVVRGMILAHTLPVAVTTGPVTINQDIKALVCGQRIQPEFLHAVLAGQAEWILSQADSSAHGTKKLETEVLQRFEVPCPPLDLQRRIVATMRAQAMRLDEVVAAKQRVLDLLAEKRKAIIATAVTRGVDPKVKLRDSGVPWLGGIPVHWEVRRVRTLSEFITSGPRGWSERVSDEGSLFIQSGDLNDVLQVEFDTAKRVRVDYDAEAARTRLQDGDIVVCITGAKTGNVAVCASVPEPAYVNQHLCLVRPNRAVLPVFLGAALKSTVGQAQLALFQYGLKQGLNLENVREVLIALPALDEQRVIVDHIARETAKLDAVRAATERTITLLKERRSALIAAAVTGQLDVGVAA